MSTYAKGDRVLIRGEVVEHIEGVGVKVEVFSKTDQYRAWVREDLVTSGVVLDPSTLKRPRIGGDDNFTTAALVRMMRLIANAEGHTYRADVLRELADQIEAQTKPPRIPEPGWSGVVEAHTAQNSDRLRWQRDSGTHSAHWVCEDTLEYDRTWDVLIDPILVRPGIEDEQ